MANACFFNCFGGAGLASAALMLITFAFGFRKAAFSGLSRRSGHMISVRRRDHHHLIAWRAQLVMRGGSWAS